MSHEVSGHSMSRLGAMVACLKNHPDVARLRQIARRVYAALFSIMFMPLRIVAALPFLLAVWIVSPIRKIRFAHIGVVNHIGWLAVLPEVYLREWERRGTPERTTVFFLMRNPDNRALFDLYRRRIDIIESRWIHALADFIAPVMKAAGVFLYEHRPAFDHKRWATTGPVLSLNKDDDRKGLAALEAMGVGANDWFVGFHARDSLHYDYSAHEYRNSSIVNCLSAMKRVSARGGYAIRMGATVAEKLPETGDPRIIDYATRFRTEFMDVYLAARSRFFLGNTAGIVCVPVLFNRPVAMANSVTLSHLATSFRPSDPYICKLYRDPTGRLLTFAELHALGMFSNEFSSESFTETLERYRLECVENTADEIADLCDDMFDMLEGRTPDAETRRLQETYRDRFLGPLPHKDYQPLLAPRFVRRHAALIEA